jgi:selenophosphate synthase
VYRLTDDLAIVQTIDFFPPVVDDAYVYGQIAAANALSDIYAMGATPRTALNLVGYPDDKDPSLQWLGKILEGGAERCVKAGAVILGGHTVRDAEIKFGLAVTGTIHPDSTDVTGFGLAGHAFEMAEGSGTTIVLDLGKLPLIPGAENLAHKPFLTRASATNALYVAPSLRIEGKPDPVRLEFFYDAQTSGGLLISVAAERAEELMENARKRGAEAACIIGEVREREDVALIVRE